MTDKIIVEFIPAERWWKTPNWRLAKSYTSANGEVTVPVGFVSDGATIPWFARRWFSSTGNYFGAAIVHDYILEHDRDWKNANHQFWEELNALGIPGPRKRVLKMAVKLYYHWLKVTGRD